MSHPSQNTEHFQHYLCIHLSALNNIARQNMCEVNSRQHWRSLVHEGRFFRSLLSEIHFHPQCLDIILRMQASLGGGGAECSRNHKSADIYKGEVDWDVVNCVISQLTCPSFYHNF